MKCRGCYKETSRDLCPGCRKKLFDGKKISAVLSFDAPKADNLAGFQEHSKRLSISGVQLKYSLKLDNNKLVLTEKGGQYILKPVPPTTQYVSIEAAPENEHLTMQIAEQVFKIKTAANAFVHFKDGAPAYLTRRFDVKPDNTKTLQEDFAQLTGRTKSSHGEAFKYDGSYTEIGELIHQHVAAALPAVEQYFELVVFNYIFSNGDAHLKNFSLYRVASGEYLLTPAYDLMSTVIHTPQESDMALNLYSKDIESSFYSTYGYYGKENFLELAARLKIMEKRANRILDHFPAKLDKIKLMVAKSFLDNAIKSIYIKNVEDKLKRIQQ
ncbi:MAG: hypothetical protein RLZZ28_816 [Bacteroidota bacterium]